MILQQPLTNTNNIRQYKSECHNKHTNSVINAIRRLRCSVFHPIPRFYISWCFVNFQCDIGGNDSILCIVWFKRKLCVIQNATLIGIWHRHCGCVVQCFCNVQYAMCNVHSILTIWYATDAWHVAYVRSKINYSRKCNTLQARGIWVCLDAIFMVFSRNVIHH